MPDDVAQEHADRAADKATYRSSLSLAELPLAFVEDDRLARVLGELGRAVEARTQAQGRELAKPHAQERGITSCHQPERESAGQAEYRSMTFKRDATTS